MKLTVLALLLLTLVAIEGEKHSLKYIYTALSLPSKTTIPEFTAMGLLDHRQLDYFDNKNRTKVPRKPWMLRELGQEYFDKGTESRLNKMQWFKVNLDILMKRMLQNNTDAHILQWQHGCEVDLQPGGKDTYIRGIDRYSYDGHDFLDYDVVHDVWVSTLDAAKLTKDKWNQVKELISYTDGYLKTECMVWLKRFRELEDKEPRTDKPELHIFSKKSRSAKTHMLTCLATGLPSKNIRLVIRRDNRVLDQDDGLKTIAMLPNQDETYQQRIYVELLRSDKASYSCHVPKLNLSKIWEPPTEDSNTAIIAGVVAVVAVCLIVLAAVAVRYIRNRKVNYRLRELPGFVLDSPPEYEPPRVEVLPSDETKPLFGKDSPPEDEPPRVEVLPSAETKLLIDKGPGSTTGSKDSGAGGSTASLGSDSNSSDSGKDSPDSGAGSEDGRTPRPSTGSKDSGDGGSTASLGADTNSSDSGNDSPDSGAGSEDARTPSETAALSGSN